MISPQHKDIVTHYTIAGVEVVPLYRMFRAHNVIIKLCFHSMLILTGAQWLHRVVIFVSQFSEFIRLHENYT